MVRDYESGDKSALEDIHGEQGFDYKFPDLESPLFLVKKVREVNGRVVGALLMRLSLETYLLCSGGPEDKMAAMQELQPEALREAWIKGISDVFCVIPPEINQRFAKRLKQMGWNEDRPWPMWSRSTGETVGT